MFSVFSTFCFFVFDEITFMGKYRPKPSVCFYLDSANMMQAHFLAFNREQSGRDERQRHVT